MLTERKVEQAPFLKGIQENYQQYLADDPMGRLRAKAWDRFLDVGLPSRNDEAFRYLRLHELYASPYCWTPCHQLSSEDVAPYVLPECVDAVAVFVDGDYQPELSRFAAVEKDLVVSSLADASRTFGPFLHNRGEECIKEESDPFMLANLASHSQGLFLYLPANRSVATPIQLLHLVTGRSAAAPRQHLYVGSGAMLQVAVTTASLSDEPCWSNHGIDIVIEENARVSMAQASSRLSQEAWHFEAARAFLKKDARFDCVNVTAGGRAVRSSYGIVLSGAAAEASLSALAALRGRREAHAHVVMDHRAPHCPSRQLFKNGLSESARSSFEGKILVRRPAQKTDAFQLNNNLLLSDKAHADSKPNLEIFADDVKASHGATVGQLDADSLFYCRTRGYSEREAKQLLLAAYATEVLDQLGLESLRREALAFVDALC